MNIKDLIEHKLLKIGDSIFYGDKKVTIKQNMLFETDDNIVFTDLTNFIRNYGDKSKNPWRVCKTADGNKLDLLRKKISSKQSMSNQKMKNIQKLISIKIGERLYNRVGQEVTVTKDFDFEYKDMNGKKIKFANPTSFCKYVGCLCENGWNCLRTINDKKTLNSLLRKKKRKYVNESPFTIFKKSLLNIIKNDRNQYDSLSNALDKEERGILIFTFNLTDYLEFTKIPLEKSYFEKDMFKLRASANMNVYNEIDTYDIYREFLVMFRILSDSNEDEILHIYLPTSRLIEYSDEQNHLILQNMIPTEKIIKIYFEKALEYKDLYIKKSKENTIAQNVDDTGTVFFRGCVVCQINNTTNYNDLKKMEWYTFDQIIKIRNYEDNIDDLNTLIDEYNPYNECVLMISMQSWEDISHQQKLYKKLK